MRRAAVLAIALLLAAVPVVQGGTSPKVSGDYTYAYGIGTTTVSLEAVGTTTATGTFHFERDQVLSGDPPSVDGNVVCMIIDDQDAWVIGVVTTVYSGDVEDPSVFLARVYDSGLRGGVGDMAVSFLGPGTPPPDCKMPLQWNLTAKWMVPITSGNILVH